MSFILRMLYLSNEFKYCFASICYLSLCWFDQGLFFPSCCFIYSNFLALSSVLWCPVRFPHKNDVWFVFTFSCLLEDSCLIYVICVCLRIVVSNAYCFMFLLFFFFVLCAVYCHFLWIVHSWLPLRCSLTFIDGQNIWNFNIKICQSISVNMVSSLITIRLILYIIIKDTNNITN